MDPTPSQHPESDLDAFRASMEEFKRTTSDPHWRDIDPLQLTAEDGECWRRVESDSIGAVELRAKANEVMAGKGRSMYTDTRSNFYAYLINVVAARLAEAELKRMRSQR